MNEFASWSVQDWEAYQTEAEGRRIERESKAWKGERIYMQQWPIWGRLIYHHERASVDKDGRTWVPSTFGYHTSNAEVWEQSLDLFLCGYGFDRTSCRFAHRGED